MKKLIFNIFLVISFFVGGILWANADATPAPANTTLENRNNQCDANGNCFDRPSFTIDVSTFSPGWKDFLWKGTGKEVSNLFLWAIVRRLIVALWIIALLIMTIWAGFMIAYGGEEGNITKGKSIFKAGFIALFIALSSYTIMSIIIYILYN